MINTCAGHFYSLIENVLNYHFCQKFCSASSLHISHVNHFWLQYQRLFYTGYLIIHIEKGNTYFFDNKSFGFSGLFFLNCRLQVTCDLIKLLEHSLLSTDHDRIIQMIDTQLLYGKPKKPGHGAVKKKQRFIAAIKLNES